MRLNRRRTTIRRAPRAAAGIALLEVAIAMPIVLVALAMLAQIYGVGASLREVGRQEWAASSAAQNTLERMRNEDFRMLFRLYNADPFDDPGGPGTAPGHRFAQRGLIPLDADPDQMVGEIVFPALNTGSALSPKWEVREDLVSAEVETPRDLNGDSVIDGLDHGVDYTILPVLVRLRWSGRHGPRELRLLTILSELR